MDNETKTQHSQGFFIRGCSKPQIRGCLGGKTKEITLVNFDT